MPKEWDGRLARFFLPTIDGRDARPTKFLSNGPMIRLAHARLMPRHSKGAYASRV
jgi:hypothetical protein